MITPSSCHQQWHRPGVKASDRWRQFHAAVEESVTPPSAALSTLAMLREVIAQALRYWSVAALREKWNTRAIVIPGDEPVTRG